MPAFARARIQSVARALSCLLWAVGCSGSRAQVLPEAGLADSSASQAEFRVLRSAWYPGSPRDRAALEPRLRAFLVRFPRDRRSDTVRLWLAWSYTDRGALSEARALVHDVQSRAG